MKKFNHYELIHLARISKIIIFIKIFISEIFQPRRVESHDSDFQNKYFHKNFLSSKEFVRDGTSRLIQISKINIFIKFLSLKRIRLRYDESLDLNF